MIKNLFFLLCLIGFFTRCSTNNSLLKRHNYAEVINDATFRLSCDADNRRAGQLLQKAYGEALVYYQNEIDSILTSNDSSRWTKTLDIMQKTNDLSDEIRYNSIASQLICEPKIYTTEISDVKQKAVAELYDAGIRCLNLKSKQKAKEAYFYFIRARKLNPDHKDVSEKIQESKDLATIKVVIDSIPAHTQHNLLSFSTKKFYEAMFYELRLKFPYAGFVNFYTFEDALKQNIENPDQIVQIKISDFGIRSYTTLERKNTMTSVPLKKLELIDGKYVWINNVDEVNYFDMHSELEHEHEREYSRLDMKSYVAININSFSEDKVLCKYRIPWNYTVELNYSYKSIINQTHISLSPDNQIFFDHYSLSLCDPVVDRLSDFFMQYK